MAKRDSRPFKRSGLHRLECSCGGYTYCTVAALEAFGVPSCGCGERFEPNEVDLAVMLGLEDAPAVMEYRSEIASILHGRASHNQKFDVPLEQRKGREARMTADELAAERCSSRRRERARSNRLSALLPAPEPMPF